MSDDRPEDRNAIKMMLGEMYRGWAANDADAFVRYYNNDATAILPGSLRAGKKVIRDMMAAGFEGPLKGTSTVNKQLSLRFLGEDAAVATEEAGILFAEETAVPDDRKIYATWTFEKCDGQWMVAAYHNSPARGDA